MSPQVVAVFNGGPGQAAPLSLRAQPEKRAGVALENLALLVAIQEGRVAHQGADALLDRFSAADISDVVDVDRKNVCKKKRFGIF